MPACSRHSKGEPETLYREARLKFQQGDLIAASEDADRGHRRYEKSAPDWAWRFRVLKSEILVWRGLSKDSLALLQEELPSSLASDEAAVRRKLAQGLANFYLQNFQEAERRLDEAEQLALQEQPGLLGEVALSKGVPLVLRNNYSAAEASFRRALELARQQQQPFLEANALGSLGLVYMRRQRFSEAIDWYQACLKLSRTLGARTQQAKTLGNLGWSYYKLGDTENSLALFTDAEKLSAELGLLRDQQVWLTNIGIVYSNLNDYGAAESYYLRALSIAKKLENKSSTAICLDNLARLALNAKEFDKAEQYNREALALKRATGNRSSELYGLLNQARIAQGRGKYQDAQALLQQVAQESGEDVSLRWEAQADLANVYVSQNKPAIAEQQFRKAIATVDSARSRLSKEEYRLSFLASASRFYNDYIDFLVARGRAKDALAIAEHSRGRTLAEGLGVALSGTSLLPVNFRPEQTAKEQRATILAYWLKPERSYLWVISPSKVSLFNLPPDDQIESAVQGYRKALLGPRDVRDAANPQGQELYQMLVAPAQKLIPAGSRVVVVADGALNNLSFETLLVSTPQVHYWIEDAVISNASSLLLLAKSRSRSAGNHKKLLLIGNPLSGKSEYPMLTQAALELQKVEEHFATERRLVFAGEKATPEMYRDSNPGQFSHIHFVAHGTASRTSPLDSAVVLSPRGDSYKLYAREIVNIPLHADLVTVSTCFGAGTRTYSGEGLVGLSWAFLRAGAHHVIAALWEVNDASTPQLMDQLYAGIDRGQDPAMALRSAKLALLHSGTIYRRPFYWAPFQLYTGS